LFARAAEKRHITWHSPLAAGLKGELRIFECEDCGKKIKIIAED
jgi:hypothetical protein